jgi:trehalose 6-phosphate phosphatase
LPVLVVEVHHRVPTLDTEQLSLKIDNQLTAVLAQRPLGLIFDIDGTLSPIAPTPEEARLYPGVAGLLEQVSHCEKVHVAIMTGREIEDGAKMVNVEGLTYIGTHGLEWSDGLPWRHPVQLAAGALDHVAPGKYLLDLVETHLERFPGVIVQRKRVGGSIHYRLAPDKAATRERLLALLEEPARQVHMNLFEGKLIVEVRAPLAVDKGQALRAFAERFATRGLVFAGDDRTDLDAIRAMQELRQQGISAFSIVVQHADTLPELLEQGDMVVEGVPEMADLLKKMVGML